MTASDVISNEREAGTWDEENEVHRGVCSWGDELCDGERRGEPTGAPSAALF